MMRAAIIRSSGCRSSYPSARPEQEVPVISRRIPVIGELMGQRIATHGPSSREDVVRITVEGRPEGPAENSIILVRVSEAGEKRARYISWIGYHDLDRKSTRLNSSHANISYAVFCLKKKKKKSKIK